MRYIKNEIKSSLTYQFNGSQKEYNDWAEALWDSGYNMSIQELANKLGISTSWIVNKWFSEIRHVIYSRKFIYSKTGREEGTSRVCWEEVKEYLIEACTFEVQTEVIDLYSYMALADKKTADKIYKMYQKSMADGFYNKGIISPTILNEINKHFVTNLDLRNISMNSTKIGKCRSTVPWTPAKRFDFIDNPNLYIPSDIGQTCYREAFLRGDIKIKLGNKKTWFIKNDIDWDRYKIPFTIPYNKSINFQKIS